VVDLFTRKLTKLVWNFSNFFVSFYEFSNLLDLSKKKLRIFLHGSPCIDLSIHKYTLSLQLILDLAIGFLGGVAVRATGIQRGRRRSWPREQMGITASSQGQINGWGWDGNVVGQGAQRRRSSTAAASATPGKGRQGWANKRRCRFD
jgi:hypothetical protein